ncbi:hypothetical protein F5Y04DRAFT_45188 [Hypomontagnella monticulosa]|nr:hypothetical protein F5Y04DRAFT_45188 [Hypomontagnella monticulosa]
MLLARSFLVGCAVAFSSVSATISSPNVVVNGASSADTLHALRRALVDYQSHKRDEVAKNSTSLEKNWDGAKLLSIAAQTQTEKNVSLNAGVDITCTTCYIKGVATTEFTVDGNFNATQIIQNYTSEVKDEILNTTDQVIDSIDNYFSGVVANLQDGIDLSDFDIPPVNISFNVDVPDLPECHLRFGFDGLELYMLVDTILSAGATYDLNLYSSKTPIGISASKDLFIGVVFTVDLILSVEAQIDISSGIHIKLEDGVGLDMVLFGQDVSSITFNGADFEFLPVTVESAGGILSAILRVGVKAGINLATPNTKFLETASAGVGVSVWADIAEFTTNVTAVPEGDDEDCVLRVEQTYQFGLGAAAGATLAIGPETWGPAPSTNIPIFYTTLADVCATQRPPQTTSAPTASISARAEGDLVTTTTVKELTFTGTGCLTTGLVNCPASLQTTTKVTSTTTLTATVTSGSEATFPDTTGTGVATPVPFGANVKTIEATTGTPASYVPPPPTSSGDTPGGAGPSSEHPIGEVNGVDTRVIVGVSVGLGVPVVAGIIIGIYFWQRRRKYAAVARNDPVYVGTSSPNDTTETSQGVKTKVTTVSTTGHN